MHIVTIKRYEMNCRTRWGWHTFRAGKEYAGPVVGFRFLGIGLSWDPKCRPLRDARLAVMVGTQGFRRFFNSRWWGLKFFNAQ